MSLFLTPWTPTPIAERIFKHSDRIDALDGKQVTVTAEMIGAKQDARFSVIVADDGVRQLHLDRDLFLENRVHRYPNAPIAGAIKLLVEGALFAESKMDWTPQHAADYLVAIQHERHRPLIAWRPQD